MTDTPQVKKHVEIVIIRETLRDSIASDLCTFSMIVGCWSLGHFAESAALEWIGVLMGGFMVVVKGIVKLSGKSARKTPEEAREWLNVNYPEEAGK